MREKDEGEGKEGGKEGRKRKKEGKGEMKEGQTIWICYRE